MHILYTDDYTYVHVLHTVLRAEHAYIYIYTHTRILTRTRTYTRTHTLINRRCRSNSLPCTMHTYISSRTHRRPDARFTQGSGIAVIVPSIGPQAESTKVSAPAISFPKAAIASDMTHRVSAACLVRPAPAAGTVHHDLPGSCMRQYPGAHAYLDVCTHEVSIQSECNHIHTHTHTNTRKSAHLLFLVTCFSHALWYMPKPADIATRMRHGPHWFNSKWQSPLF